MFVGLLSVCTMGRFGESLVSHSKVPIKSLNLKNRPSQVSVEGLLYSFIVSVNTCGGSFKTIYIHMLGFVFKSNVKSK